MKNSFLNKLKMVLNTDLLIKELLTIPTGATHEAIAQEEKIMGKTFSQDYKDLLKIYNGIDLDIIRFYGVGETATPIKRLAEKQEYIGPEDIAIGDDPVGFVYIQDMQGRIYSIDTDGGEKKYLTESLSELIDNYIFGNDAVLFGGKSWERELRNSGII